MKTNVCRACETQFLSFRTKQGQVELELNPLCVSIFKHQTVQRQPNVPTIVGGYSAAAMQAGVR